MLTDRDLPTLHAAASALRHAPPHMRAQHLAERLEEMAGRIRALTGSMVDDSGRLGADGGDISLSGNGVALVGDKRKDGDDAKPNTDPA